VIDKEVDDLGRDSKTYWTYLRWKLQYQDGSPVEAGVGELKDPVTEMLGSDGEMHMALFEIKETRSTGVSYNYVAVKRLSVVINPRVRNGAYRLLDDTLIYTVSGIRPGETVEVEISKTNEDYFTYLGDGDTLTITAPE
jgi:hypothetical protein